MHREGVPGTPCEEMSELLICSLFFEGRKCSCPLVSKATWKKRWIFSPLPFVVVQTRRRKGEQLHFICCVSRERKSIRNNCSLPSVCLRSSKMSSSPGCSTTRTLSTLHWGNKIYGTQYMSCHVDFMLVDTLDRILLTIKKTAVVR